MKREALEDRIQGHRSSGFQNARVVIGRVDLDRPAPGIDEHGESECEATSKTASGHSGAKPSRCSCVSASQRSLRSHDASGDSSEPSGRWNPADGPKTTPPPRAESHRSSWPTSFASRRPDSLPVGVTTRSPVVRRSNCRPGLRRDNSRISWSLGGAASLRLMATGRLPLPCGQILARDCQPPRLLGDPRPSTDIGRFGLAFIELAFRGGSNSNPRCLRVGDQIPPPGHRPPSIAPGSHAPAPGSSPQDAHARTRSVRPSSRPRRRARPAPSATATRRP